jgi:Rrf2 family protein
MRLSKRGEYGLRAMIRMAEFYNRDGEPHLMQTKEISKIENIPVKYLEQILLAMKNAGLLNSKMGVGGGYYLARPPEEIMLGQIVRTLDGPLAPIRCVSKMAYEPCDCPDERTCGLRMAMGDVRDAIAAILDHTSLEDILKRVEAARETESVLKNN